MITPTTHAITEFPVPTASANPIPGDHGRPRRQPLVHRASAQQDRDDQPDDPRHHRVRRPDRQRLSPGITAGPDGNLWFTETVAGKIGMINPATHAITEFPIPTAGSGPTGSRRAPTATSGSPRTHGSKIGRINPATHAITEFPVPTAKADPYGITAGPDGNLWFTESHAGKIGRINPATHAITEFPIPNASSAAPRDHGRPRRQPLVHRSGDQRDRGRHTTHECRSLRGDAAAAEQHHRGRLLRRDGPGR